MIAKGISIVSAGLTSFLLGSVSLIPLASADDATTVADNTTAGQTGKTTPKVADGKIDEVVVTAQHREQSAQDLGISLSVLSQEDLVDAGVKTVNDLARTTPSLQVVPAFGSGQPEFRIRGLGFDDYASNNAPTVGIYVDGVAYPIPIMTQGQIFDVDHVEVLRGPQGTLYGRNTTGGAVNIDTNAPTVKPSAGASLEYGSNNDTKIDAYASGAVSDRFRVRLSTSAEEGGAWQKNSVTGQELGNKDRQALRLKTEWDATDDLVLKFNLHGSRDQSDGLGARLLGTVAADGATVPYQIPTSQNATSWDLSKRFSDLIGAGSHDRPFKDNTGYGANLSAEQSLGAVKITDLASYEGFDRKEFNDWDGTSSSYADEYFRTNTRVFSNELRIASNRPAALQWVGGFYYSNERLSEHFYSDFDDDYGFTALTHYTQDTKTYAEFGQVEYALTEQLKLIGGVRYEIEDRNINGLSVAALLPSGSTLSSGHLGIPYDESTGLYKVSGKIGAEYRVVDPLLLYATISRGVKSGGFTTYNTFYPDLELTPFRPEKVLTYETGFKSDLIDKRLRLNSSIYYNDYRDQQVQSSVIVDGTYTVGRFVNAPKSHTYGTEVELEARPTKALRLTEGLGYNRGSYDEFVTYDTNHATGSAPNLVAPTIDRKGQDEGFPKLSFNGSVSYEIPYADYTVTPRFDYSYSSKRTSPWGSIADIEPYWLFDAGITFKPQEGPWSVSVFGKNIFDKKYDLNRSFFTRTYVAFSGEPATFGVRLSVKY